MMTHAAMIKRLSLLLVVMLMTAILFACGQGGGKTLPQTSAPAPSSDEPVSKEPAAQPMELFVCAATSLTDALTEIAANYKAVAPNVTLTFSFASSGALQTQIEEGAPADLFVSAAQKQMDALVEKDLIVPESRRNLLVNKVVLIVPANRGDTPLTFADVATDKVRVIGLGEFASVPVGQYSEEVFTFLGILDAVTAKANYGADVRAVLTWVESGEVDCGVVYATDAATTNKVVVSAEAPTGSHKPIVYPGAVIKASRHAAEAQAFLEYLAGSDAGRVFEKYGFTLS